MGAGKPVATDRSAIQMRICRHPRAQPKSVSATTPPKLAPRQRLGSFEAFALSACHVRATWPRGDHEPITQKLFRPVMYVTIDQGPCHYSHYLAALPPHLAGGEQGSRHR